jgi:hypothetical protein
VAFRLCHDLFSQDPSAGVNQNHGSDPTDKIELSQRRSHATLPDSQSLMELALEILQRTLISELILPYLPGLLRTDLLDHDCKPSENQVQYSHHAFDLSTVNRASWALSAAVKKKAGSLSTLQDARVIALLRRVHFHDTLNSIPRIIRPTESSWKI